MILLDEPFASTPLLEWAAETSHPVLANSFSLKLQAIREEQGAPLLHVVEDEEAIARINGGERVYTNGENALAWILEHCNNPGLTDAISLFKDKAAMRVKLQDLNPELFYQVYKRDELAAVDPLSLPLPVVLKPSVGFCSMGVYVIQGEADWREALDSLAREEDAWHERYPESVVGSEDYIVESYIGGVEYALDMYYDEAGSPHILNVLRHDFASAEDTSDRLYITNAAIVQEMLPRFQSWLEAVNQVVGARNFPIHVEVRVDGSTIAPIEFNPLRFAGLGGTDVAYYGVGLRTYAAYLEDQPVEVEALYQKTPTHTYSMSLLNPSKGADLSAPFDYEGLESCFEHPLALVPFEADKVGFWGFLFLETEGVRGQEERDFILHTDLTDFELPQSA